MDWRAHIARHGTDRFPGAAWARRALLAIVLLAAVLRFWDLPHLPYTHDELSALSRIHPSFAETIRVGVAELDTHPPAVQAFLWLWTKLFSVNEADVKLPFILMSLAAIALLYRFALAWTSEGAALALAVLMAVLQHSVFYSQLARPYAAGLFTTALLTDQLTRWLAFGSPRALVAMGAAASLSAATHHFSLMLAAIIAATGLLLAAPEHRKAYLSMCAAAIALYLPIAPITLHQLGQGGLQWLPPPDEGWLARYAGYIAHWSPAMAGTLLAAMAASLWLTVRRGGAPNPARWLLLLWGSLPLAIGYAYSVWRAPVLQYSMLLFSLPYLLLFLLQGLMHLRPRSALIGCVLLAIVGVRTLAGERKHYIVAYHSKFEAAVREALAAAQEHGKDEVLALFDAPPHMIDFYRRHWGVPDDAFRFAHIQGRPQAEVDSILARHHGGTVVLGRANGSNEENPAIVQQRFPALIRRIDMAEGQAMTFQRGTRAIELFDRDTVAHLSMTTAFGPWHVDDWLPRGPAGWDYTGLEFGILIELPLDSIVARRDDLIEVVAVVEGFGSGDDAAVVADVRCGDATVLYRGGDLLPRARPDSAASLAVAVSPSMVRQPSGPMTLRAYVYNRGKGPLRVRSATVLRRAANVLREGFLEPVPWLGRYPPE